MADVVDDENVADKPLHLGGGIGVVFIEIETVDALAEGLHKRHEPGIGRIGDVVDAKPGILEFVTPAGAGLVLGIGDHEITHHAHLVGVRELVRHHQPADDLRLARVGHVEDRRPLGSVLVTDIGVMPLNHDLAPARQFCAAEMTNIRRCLRRRAGITGMEDVGHDFISRASAASGDGRSAAKSCGEKRGIPAAGQRQHHPSDDPAGHEQLRRRSMDSACISADNRRTDLESRRRPPGRSPEAQSGKRERSDMTTKSRLYLGVAALAIAVVLTGSVVEVSAQQSAPPAVAIDNDDIGGVVTGASGPEAGVWVIAETTDLPTRYAKMVVTDDQGRYVVPDLPKAKYKVWVRGYGLVDSAKVDGEPGKQLNLRATAAPSEAEAAKYYPAIYWYAMMKIPDASEFGKKDNDIPDKITQAEWLSVIKNRACIGCHQIGQLSTRTIPAAFGEFKSGEDAWRRRTMAGQAAPLMINPLAGYLGGAPYKYFGEWTDRVAKGELPHAKPPRPQGVERNVVVTTWDWGNEKQYLHDLISSDRRNPTVNANGKLYGSPEYATDVLPILDPKTNTVTNFKAPVQDPEMPESLGQGHAAVEKPVAPSAYWGEEKIWDSRVNNHNSMFDGKGRVWLAAAIRGPDNPDFCKKGSDHPSAKAFPIEKNVRQVAILDPQSMKYTFVDTCFGSHHLQFDAKDRVWTSGAGGIAGWVDMKIFDETGDAAKAQGWSPFVLDTNGNGKRDEYTEPNQPADAAKDARITG